MIKKKEPRKPCIGVDIGSHSIKALEALSDQDKFKITKFATADISSNPSHEVLLSAIKTITEKANFASRDVHIALSGPDVTVRFINMPVMNLQELKNSLRYEADKYIPFSIDEVVIDSSILENIQEEKTQMRVLLAAAKKDIIAKRIELFRQIGYNVKLIDVDDFAIFNAFLKSQQNLDKEKSTALINIGHRYTNVIVFRGDCPYFTRDIQIGGEEINKTLSKQLNIEEQEAIKLKINPQDKAGEVASVVKGVLNNLTDEIRLSFGYYENQYGRSVDQMYLSGGSAGIGDLPNYFEENLGLKPEIWNPLGNFTIEKTLDSEKLDKLKYSLAVSCGLVIR